MVVSQAGNGLRQAAPAAAAAVAIVGALVGGSLLVKQPDVEPAPLASEISLAPEAPSASPDITPAPTAPALPEPGSAVPGVAFDQAPGGAPALAMEIVVKFKDDSKVKDIIDTFWRDPAGAKAKFAAFARNRPEMAGVALDRVTYSNELVLVHKGGVPADQRLSAMRDIAKKLASTADISYAEPNMTAHPGGQ